MAKRGDDDGGRLALTRLEARGVGVVSPVVPAGNGMIVSLVAPDGERTMASIAAWRRPSSPPSSKTAGSRATRGATSRATRSCATRFVSPPHGRGLIARRGLSPVSVDLSSWSAIRDFGPRRSGARSRLGPDAVFCSEDEDRIVGGRFPGPAWILGAVPAAARSTATSGLHSRSARSSTSTGAGDALAAGWLVPVAPTPRSGGGTVRRAGRGLAVTSAAWLAR